VQNQNVLIEQGIKEIVDPLNHYRFIDPLPVFRVGKLQLFFLILRALFKPLSGLTVGELCLGHPILGKELALRKERGSLSTN
jgi:hypothetical protein